MQMEQRNKSANNSKPVILAPHWWRTGEAPILNHSTHGDVLTSQPQLLSCTGAVVVLRYFRRRAPGLTGNA